MHVIPPPSTGEGRKLTRAIKSPDDIRCRQGLARIKAALGEPLGQRPHHSSRPNRFFHAGIQGYFQILVFRIKDCNSKKTG